MKTLGFVGFGRFGHALSEIFAEQDYRIRAFDPSLSMPEGIATSSLRDLVAASQILFVAVPVSAMPAVFADLKGLLSPGQIVVDVGSVKMAPVRWMSEIFGADQPWVASHPLFGPVSLARAETGLRVVVCPHTSAPSAVAEVSSLYRSIGCQIVELDPETHDRIMAQTHAMAFFVAKGMLDAEVPTDSPAAPPSFQAMARTIESVRGDAGHLITTLHRENPFSAEYRRRLLYVLRNLDQKLNEAPTSHPGTPEEAELTISSPAHIPELSETRERIDEVDGEILQLLLRRAELVRRAQHAKAAAGRGVVDVDRESRLLEARCAWADNAGLDSGGVRHIFEAIIALSCEIQSRQA
ncbi:MAG TPA: prephenate dehydrogenase/arogenate dehydrogenase family protein [Fimbriimonadaceae bacterium]|nr:prephenate dehydrogenase/arogenate dehydrogenase family protein [Fimbriimonadaceae bacterium]